MQELRFSIATSCGDFEKVFKPATANEVLQPATETRFFTELQNITQRYEPLEAVINCVVFDIDYKKDKRTFNEIFDEVQSVFANFSFYNYIAYTTKSYKAEKPCFRLILPLDRPLRVNVPAYKRIKINLCSIHDNNCHLFFKTPPLNSEIDYSISQNKPNYPANKIAWTIKQFEAKEKQKNDFLEATKRKFEANFTDGLRKNYILKCAETMNAAPIGSRNTTANKILWTLKQKHATQIDVAYLVQNLTNEDNKREFLKVLNQNPQYSAMRR